MNKQVHASENKVNTGGLKLLKPAVNQTAFLKAGIMGFAGSGKTFTAHLIAKDLSKEVSDGKPVAFFDTETGSDFLIKSFKESGIEMLVLKSRSFKDLLGFMDEAESVCSVAIIDSISHVWTELLEAYQRRLNRKNGLYFQDWGAVKQEWRQFTDRYVNAKLHVVLCGRAGYEYDYQENETGKKELIKTGTKMKAETEMGYEPSLLLEMVRIKKSEETGDMKEKGWTHRCYILKDRTNLLNGQDIDNPTFESFRPVIDFLDIGGEHVGVDTSRVSDDLFDSPDRSWTVRAKQVEITLEEIQQELILMGLDGASNDAKRARTELMIELFGTSSKTAIESLQLEKLQDGLAFIRDRRIEGNKPKPELKQVAK